MAYNRRSGGGGYGGYGSGGGGFGGGGGGRFNNGGGYRAGPSSVNPWQTSSGSNGPLPRQTQQGGHPPPTLAMASNLLNKLLTSSNSMVTMNRLCVNQIFVRFFHLLMAMASF